MNSDFKDLLQLFNAGEVRYLLVGGYAVMHYTEPRYTKDIDLWVEATAKNLMAVKKAAGRPQDLIDLGALGRKSE